MLNILNVISEGSPWNLVWPTSSTLIFLLCASCGLLRGARLRFKGTGPGAERPTQIRPTEMIDVGLLYFHIKLFRKICQRSYSRNRFLCRAFAPMHGSSPHIMLFSFIRDLVAANRAFFDSFYGPLTRYIHPVIYIYNVIYHCHLSRCQIRTMRAISKIHKIELFSRSV